jgi:hypothetical protein
MVTIRLSTPIDAPPERVFDLARSIDQHTRSLDWTGEEPVAGRMSGLIGLGETVAWRGTWACGSASPAASARTTGRGTCRAEGGLLSKRTRGCLLRVLCVFCLRVKRGSRRAREGGIGLRACGG